MNIFQFLTPKSNVAYVEINCTNGKSTRFQKGNFIYIPKNLCYTISFHGVQKNTCSE